MSSAPWQQVAPSASFGSSLELVDVNKFYQSGTDHEIKAVQNLSLSVPAGQSVALVGSSGSGKSTLLHLIGAIDKADSGQIRVGDTSITSLKGNAAADYRASIGIIFQHFYLIDSLSALDNVMAPLIGRKPRKTHRDLALEALAQVGLADRAASTPQQLSGGQQQRVAIARALVVKPHLLLADEPTGNLDSDTSAQILELLAQLQTQLGITMLVATHDLAAARQLDRMIELKDGQIIKDNSRAVN
ncbi:ABC transporter ATP-binding protein [Boudabousia marimammalium]|uniref:ABC transporter domain-containing protein n=1 Tax=Boudabousia marimammalium TaxID=156892 RepID=A0A1Q5PSE3_9ACTO|nr:ABC transporter ATP-binding protein [Boudabousia marimammalium]OKL50504.1 hypothetical protein BM477_00580 [Boudabousia marimammalium]